MWRISSSSSAALSARGAIRLSAWLWLTLRARPTAGCHHPDRVVHVGRHCRPGLEQERQLNQQAARDHGPGLLGFTPAPDTTLSTNKVADSSISAVSVVVDDLTDSQSAVLSHLPRSATCLDRDQNTERADPGQKTMSERCLGRGQKKTVRGPPWVEVRRKPSEDQTMGRGQKKTVRGPDQAGPRAAAKQSDHMLQPENALLQQSAGGALRSKARSKTKQNKQTKTKKKVGEADTRRGPGQHPWRRPGARPSLGPRPSGRTSLPKTRPVCDFFSQCRLSMFDRLSIFDGTRC
eukprot:3731766-Rhodomonas_salina.2